MKRINLSLILLFISLALSKINNAQQVKLTWSNLETPNYSTTKFFKGTDNSIIVSKVEKSGNYKTYKESATFSKLDYQLHLKNTETIPYNQDYGYFQNIIKLKDALYIMYKKGEEKSEKRNFNFFKVDVEPFKVSNKPVVTEQYVNNKWARFFNYIYSADSSKILMFSYSRKSLKKVNENYDIKVFDNKMNNLWSKVIEIPISDDNAKISSYFVTNQGQVGIIVKHFDKEFDKFIESNKKDNDDDTKSYKTKLFLYESTTEIPSEYEINVNNNYVHSISLLRDKGDKLTLFGLYKNISSGNINGFFTANVDIHKHQIETANLNPFSEELLNLVKNDKQGSYKSKNPGLDFCFKINQILDREDGSKDCLIEYQYYYHRAANGISMSSDWGEIKYDYGDIVVISFKKDDKFVVTRIPKKQESEKTDRFGGYKAIPYYDKLLVFYNDHLDNAKNNLSSKLITLEVDKDIRKKCGLFMATIDSNGNVKRSLVYDYNDDKINVSFIQSELIDNRHLALYATDFEHTNSKMGILEVK